MNSFPLLEHKHKWHLSEEDNEGAECDYCGVSLEWELIQDYSQEDIRFKHWVKASELVSLGCVDELWEKLQLKSEE